jgi:hypothetical protein
VEEIELDGQGWTAVDDFYSSYLAAVGAPEWHGHNLDALWDSLTGAGINERNLPFRFRIGGTALMCGDVFEIVGRFQTLVCEAERDGHPVHIELLP